MMFPREEKDAFAQEPRRYSFEDPRRCDVITTGVPSRIEPVTAAHLGDRPRRGLIFLIEPGVEDKVPVLELSVLGEDDCLVLLIDRAALAEASDVAVDCIERMVEIREQKAFILAQKRARLVVEFEKCAKIFGFDLGDHRLT